MRAVKEHHERLERIETELQEKAKGWRFYPVFEALQVLRGVQFTVALSTVAELGDNLALCTGPKARRSGT